MSNNNKYAFGRSPEHRNSSQKEVVPPIFRLGDNSQNHEVIVANKRILSWNLRGGDEQLAELAGWSVFPVEYTEKTGTIQLPAGTRNARSVLSGLEAWSGEKATVVEKVSEYLSAIYSHFGTHDTDFSWQQVGVTPDQQIFIAPPNVPTTDTLEQTISWQDGVINELGLLLQNDDQNRNLTLHFAENLLKDNRNVS